MLPESQDPSLTGRLYLQLAHQRKITIQRQVAHQVRLGKSVEGEEIRNEEAVGEAVEDECEAYPRSHHPDSHLHTSDGARAEGKEEESRVRGRWS